MTLSVPRRERGPARRLAAARQSASFALIFPHEDLACTNVGSPTVIRMPYTRAPFRDGAAHGDHRLRYVSVAELGFVGR